MAVVLGVGVESLCNHPSLVRRPDLVPLWASFGDQKRVSRDGAIALKQSKHETPNLAYS